MSNSGGEVEIITALLLANSATPCSRFTIIGTYAEDSDGFLKHAALLKNSTSVSLDDSVNVWHTGPPIVSGPVAEAQFGRTQIVAHTIADCKLRPSECDAIVNFLASVDKYHRTASVLPLQQYVIVPHHQWVVAPETNRRIRRRFNCAGFVIEAFVSAGIQLMDVDNLPLASREDVEFAFPDFRRLAEASERVQERVGFHGMEDFGITGDGPWPIALPGYLFHACDRGENAGEFTTFIVSSVEKARFPTP